MALLYDKKVFLARSILALRPYNTKAGAHSRMTQALPLL